MKECFSKGSSRGFTLVEVLMVVLIISVLAGLVLGISGYANRKAARSQAEAQLQKLGMLFDEFKLEEGYYPFSTASSASGWYKLNTPSVNFDVLLPDVSKRDYYQNKLREIGTADPWLFSCEIRIPSTQGYELRIRSLGPDGAANTEDDVELQ